MGALTMLHVPGVFVVVAGVCAAYVCIECVDLSRSPLLFDF